MRTYKKLMRGSNLYYLENHQEDIERFMFNMIDMDSWNDFKYLVWEKRPNEFSVILKDFRMRNTKKVEEIIRHFKYGKSKIMYVCGARDSGKTCFSFWLAEEIHLQEPRMRIAYVGVKLEESVRPKWCDNFEDINDVPYGYLVILDELAVKYNAREHATTENISLGQLLAIARHKDLSVIAITQDPNMGEINVWRLKDMIVYKRSNTYELPDRDTKGSRTSKIMEFWRYIKRWLKPTRQEQALFEYQANNRVMLLIYPIPECWNEKLSKAFRIVDVRMRKQIIEVKAKKNKGIPEGD